MFPLTHSRQPRIRCHWTTNLVVVRYLMMIYAPGAAIFTIDPVKSAFASSLKKRVTGLLVLTLMAMPNPAPNCA
jgi:hypothetical protein